MIEKRVLEECVVERVSVTVCVRNFSYTFRLLRGSHKLPESGLLEDMIAAEFEIFKLLSVFRLNERTYLFEIQPCIDAALLDIVGQVMK